MPISALGSICGFLGGCFGRGRFGRAPSGAGQRVGEDVAAPAVMSPRSRRSWRRRRDTCRGRNSGSGRNSQRWRLRGRKRWKRTGVVGRNPEKVLAILSFPNTNIDSSLHFISQGIIEIRKRQSGVLKEREETFGQGECHLSRRLAKNLKVKYT